ncbi:heavy metal-binding domain-containing protein [Actinoallomurus sp. NPDC050550]|uniref:heavy metal-binding domain-containing protein n=1 Tax=Actinoallomurus sp. NPDC050550 TaxID=3154937 RepID=UPI0033E20965
MERTIPLYTTEQPLAAEQRVVAGWLEWCHERNVGQALDVLAANAIRNGAHAVVGVRIEPDRSSAGGSFYIAYGTAVVFG